jgi:hypothetical protein
MSCRVCGLRLRKDERVVLVGFYPSLWKKVDLGYSPYRGLDVFGDLARATDRRCFDVC